MEEKRNTSRTQLEKIRDTGLRFPGSWLTIAELSALTHHREPSVSAVLRNLRKPKFGGFQVDKRLRSSDCHGSIAGGTRVWEYRILRPVAG